MEINGFYQEVEKGLYSVFSKCLFLLIGDFFSLINGNCMERIKKKKKSSMP